MKKLIAMLLTLATILTVLPFSAMAADNEQSGCLGAASQLVNGMIFYYDDGVTCTDEDGAPAQGWQSDDDSWYYFENGTACTGWIKDGGKWYYLDPASGAMVTGWTKDAGKWYYLNSNGTMKTGWVKDAGSWYYLTSNGNMKTGWVKDGSSWYYLKSSGAMAKSETMTISGTVNQFDANGAWIG